MIQAVSPELTGVAWVRRRCISSFLSRDGPNILICDLELGQTTDAGPQLPRRSKGCPDHDRGPTSKSPTGDHPPKPEPGKPRQVHAPVASPGQLPSQRQRVATHRRAASTKDRSAASRAPASGSTAGCYRRHSARWAPVRSPATRSPLLADEVVVERSRGHAHHESDFGNAHIGCEPPTHRPVEGSQDKITASLYFWRSRTGSGPSSGAPAAASHSHCVSLTSTVLAGDATHLPVSAGMTVTSRTRPTTGHRRAVGARFARTTFVEGRVRRCRDS